MMDRFKSAYWGWRAKRGSMTINDWQNLAHALFVSKGRDWRPEEYQVMLLRIHRKVSELYEALARHEEGRAAEKCADVFIELMNTTKVLGVDLEKEVEHLTDVLTSRPIKKV